MLDDIGCVKSYPQVLSDVLVSRNREMAVLVVGPRSLLLLWKGSAAVTFKIYKESHCAKDSIQVEFDMTNEKE